MESTKRGEGKGKGILSWMQSCTATKGGLGEHSFLNTNSIVFNNIAEKYTNYSDTLKL